MVSWFGLLQKGKANLVSDLSTGKGRDTCTPPWEMFGWFIHILMDIPTHTGLLYPTLFLWPLSDWYVDGNSWGTKWFMVINYSVLLIVFLLLGIAGKKKGRVAS